ncbi:MAG: hypothetical protein AAFX94_22365 [Myxococcota bacterium]
MTDLTTGVGVAASLVTLYVFFRDEVSKASVSTSTPFDGSLVGTVLFGTLAATALTFFGTDCGWAFLEWLHGAWEWLSLFAWDLLMWIWWTVQELVR